MTGTQDLILAALVVIVLFGATRSAFDRYHIVSPQDLQEVARKLRGTISRTIGRVRDEGER